ncbi:hypothetical protein HYS84_00160 [Candidatus Saccharibacteria bacterium]|nr:hypothetical protein [Candidatus Saccharibacteria bacterium]
MEWIKAHKVWSGVIALVVFIIIVGAATGEKKEDKNTQTNQQPTTQSQPAEQKPKPAFDIPGLMGKNIDQTREILGAPADGSLTEPTAAQPSVDVWDNTFKKDGKELLVTYKPSTREVIDFFVSTDDPSGATKDTKKLLEISGLSENSPSYTIEFVKVINDPNSYTGIKATPK